MVTFLEEGVGVEPVCFGGILGSVNNSTVIVRDNIAANSTVTAISPDVAYRIVGGFRNVGLTLILSNNRALDTMVTSHTPVSDPDGMDGEDISCSQLVALTPPLFCDACLTPTARTGMPRIGGNLQPFSLGVALRNVVASIALQEAAMAHVLNAEGEKLQRIIGLANVTPAMLMEVNQSVSGLVGGAAGIEDALQNKLKYALSIMPPPGRADFTLKVKVPNTGLPVGDSEWTLTSENGARLASLVITSEPGPEYGDVTFKGVPKGTYELTETTIPEGFLPAGVFTVYVDESGKATIRPGAPDDPDPETPVPADGYVIYQERDIESIATGPACAAS